VSATELALLERMARAAFGAGIAVGTADPLGDLPPLFPEEARALRRAVPRRRAEFAAGRAALRRAMAESGLAPRAVPMGPDRAPRWPPGLAGSLSHTETAALAVLAPVARAAALGVDIEAATPLPEDLFESVLGIEERCMVGGDGLAAKRVFCAKEAVYKAQYPLTGQVLGFEAVDVRLGPGRFEARFRTGVGRLVAGTRLLGRLEEGAGCVLAAVVIAPD